jgi:hypothetical protein
MAVKFDAAFLDRRMAEHKRWQRDVLNELLNEAMEEIAEALRTSPGFSRRAQAPVLPFPELKACRGVGARV